MLLDEERRESLEAGAWMASEEVPDSAAAVLDVRVDSFEERSWLAILDGRGAQIACTKLSYSIVKVW